MKTIIAALFSILNIQATTIGILQGKKEIIVSSKTQGEIREIHFTEGTKVKEGDIILSIDNQKETIEYELAKNDFDSAKEDYNKSKKLKKYLSGEELTKKRNLYLSKKASFELKEYALKTKEIKTPIDGILSKIFLKEGENVGSGKEAFEVIWPDNLIIDLDINAKKAQTLALGQEVLFNREIDDGEFKAKITFVGKTVDKASGTIHIILELDNPLKEDGSYTLTPGEMVKIHFKEKDSQKTVMTNN